MVKSPLRYPGGKSKHLKHLIERIPEFKEYREPFVGGGSMYLYLKGKYKNSTFWINDLYEPVYYFWLGIQINTDAVIEKIYEWKKNYTTGRSLFFFIKDNYLRFNDIEKSAGFFILNRITFSGTGDSGGYSNESFEKRFTVSSIDRLSKLKNMLTNTKITNLDYSDLMFGNEETFLFLDPPYHGSKKSALYGNNGQLHKDFNHERFSEQAKKSDCKWLITYDDSEYIRELFSFATIIDVNFNYGMRNVTKESNQKANELIIINY